ncbi:class I SAM-dependent methyltransferase [Planococcus halotolerans]|uniref:SAM-dependent methyltransferase n=1 Tax=Planococcus halotolerans TaxID=2233542 RepID=A0A365KLV3_9BACL|nr:class I SAM-dependent methyltransferase [Planococcus halotolerans]QHJ71758.1 methyltransferase domain-containing protein [Planococcus halotolerans]RAZ74026.1 SAM-dependent methyltransferase [Planococcus halotolerans]
MTLMRVLPFTKFLLEQAVADGDRVIDATAGNGHDTLFLAQLAGDAGKVYAFDIQEEAVRATKERVKDYGNVDVILDSHTNIAQYVSEEIAAAVFNLGYLPKGDHSIITKSATTLAAITQCLELLKETGLVAIVIYSGHDGGSEERDAVMDFVSQLPQTKFDVMKYQFINQQHSPPFLVAIEKKPQK